MVRLCDLPEYREVKNVNPFSSSASKDTAAEQAKNHFASNFTSAAILKADDGVNWTTQTQTDEQKKAAAAATTRRDLVGDGTRKASVLLCCCCCHLSFFFLFFFVSTLLMILRVLIDELTRLPAGLVHIGTNRHCTINCRRTKKNGRKNLTKTRKKSTRRQKRWMKRTCNFLTSSTPPRKKKSA